MAIFNAFNKPTTLRRGLAIVLAVAATAFGLAACGSDDDSSAKAAESQPLKVYISNRYDISQPGVDAADAYGIWKKRNLDVKEFTGGDGAQVLASGDADIAIGAANSTIGAIKEGLDAKIVGPVGETMDQYYVVGAKSTATSPEDLKGAKFGVSRFGSLGNYSVVALANKAGWTDKDYKIVALGDINGLLAGLQNGTIDAFAWSMGGAISAEQKGFGKVIGTADDYAPSTPGTVMTVRGGLLKDNPAAVKNFCEGFYEAQKRFAADETDTADFVVDKWGADPTTVDEALKADLPTLSLDSSFDDEQIQGLTEAAKFTTESAKDVTVDEVADMIIDCSSL